MGLAAAGGGVAAGPMVASAGYPALALTGAAAAALILAVVLFRPRGTA
jgi:hypothetical protein